jgi:succinate-acetate transporter protein
MLSGQNATYIPAVVWVGLALFYGGLIRLLSEFRDRNVFGAVGRALSSGDRFNAGSQRPSAPQTR